MPLSHNANAIYCYLVTDVLRTKRVVTYGTVSTETGVPLGQGGGAVAKALYEIFRRCDEEMLPPLSSIVVQDSGLYDKTFGHGMTGGGCLVAEAESDNLAGRCRNEGWQRWKATPRPADTETWTIRAMIEAHQDLVWDYPYAWPEEL